VEILFASEKLKRASSSHTELQRQWGREGAKKIALRLQQLAAAPTLVGLRNLPGRCHELSGERAGSLAVDVHHPYRMVFHPTAKPPPQKPDGSLDWTRVESISVTEIIDDTEPGEEV
jgi:plasmid maintenance system killer protein